MTHVQSTMILNNQEEDIYSNLNVFSLMAKRLVFIAIHATTALQSAIVALNM